jgi:CBS domain-containing protein
VIAFSTQQGERMTDEKVRTEEFQVSGDMLIAKIKELMHAGNIRRVIIKNEEGKNLIDVPLTLGVVGAILAPQLAAVGAIAALVTRCTIVVETVEEQ